MLRLFKFKSSAHNAVRSTETWLDGCDNEKEVADFQYTVKGLEVHEGYEELV